MACYEGVMPAGRRPFVLAKLRPAAMQSIASGAQCVEEQGLLLVDSGSEKSGITAACARRLGMISHDTVPIRTATGEADLTLYRIALTIDCNVGIGSRGVGDVEVFEDGSAWETDASGVEVIGLIGVDVLKLLRLELDGPGARFSLT